MNLNDLVNLERDARFPIPNPNNRLYIVQKTITDDEGKVLGAAFVHLTTEISLIWGGGVSRFERVRKMKEIFDSLLKEITDAGLEDTHIFVLPENDVGHSNFLVNKFGFKQVTGRPLYFQAGEKNGEGSTEPSD